jgi:NADH dehydrogenase
MQALVIGAGYGGLRVVQTLAQQGVSVTLLEPRTSHILRNRLITVASLRRPLKEALLDYPRLLPSSVNWVREPAVGFDPDLAQVYTDHQSFEADHLILAAGSQMTQPLGFNLYSPEAIQAIQAHWHQVQTNLEAQRCDTNLLRWVVVGGEATGVEFAAELVHLARRWRNRYGGLAGAVQIHLIHPGAELLPGWRPALADWVQRWLTRNRVLIQTDTKVKRARPEFLVLDRAGQTEELPTRTVFWTLVRQAVRFEEEPTSLRNPLGTFSVNQFGQVQGYRNIWAVGSQGDFPSVLAPTGALALQTAELIAQNILLQQKGQSLQPFTPKLENIALSVGAFDGVAQIQDQELSGTPGWTVAQATDTLYVNAVQAWNLPRLSLPQNP